MRVGSAGRRRRRGPLTRRAVIGLMAAGLVLPATLPSSVPEDLTPSPVVARQLAERAAPVRGTSAPGAPAGQPWSPASRAKPRKAGGHTLIGGSRITAGARSCTAGLLARRGRTVVLLTAGHCLRRGDAVTSHHRPVGRVASVVFPGSDYAIIPLTGSLPSTPQLPAGPRQLRVTGSREAPVGAVVCKAGAGTGWTCGRILAKNVTVRYQTPDGRSVLVRGLTKTSACSTKGDSGGPWLWGGQAQGLSSGGLSYAQGECGTGWGRPTVSYFQPINPVLQRHRLTLLTG